QSSYPVQIDELWGDAQPMSMVGTEVLSLSLEHLILHHCLHIAKHGFGVGLRPFCDLAAILERCCDQIDWQQVRVGAERWRITKAVGLAFYFTSEFFDCVPASVMETLKLSEVEPYIVESARDQILGVGSDTAQLSSEFLELWASKQNQ